MSVSWHCCNSDKPVCMLCVFHEARMMSSDAEFELLLSALGAHRECTAVGEKWASMPCSK
jgi:hypothetical protein